MTKISPSSAAWWVVSTRGRGERWRAEEGGEGWMSERVGDGLGSEMEC